MIYYKIVLLPLLIGVVLCDPLKTRYYKCRKSNNLKNTKETSNVPTEIATIQEKVEIKLYYETLCPFSVNFILYQLKPAMEKLGSYLDIHLIPYGNAETVDNGHGQYKFKCQHGPKECYGNKLHACAIDYLGISTKAVFFNSCMMKSSKKNRRSNDAAADKCGKSMNVNPEWIKQCAKGDRGNVLHKYYGDESEKVDITYVPYVMINGVENEGEDFFKDVCTAFKEPPAECAQIV